MTKNTEDAVRNTVREHYADVAKAGVEAAVACAPGFCTGVTPDISKALGYSEAEMAAVPQGANLGLGCGNPGAIAALKPGEVVIDLGSGAGFDCLLAADRVGPEGRVIGVDMTAEMVAKARANADKAGAAQVEFRLGEIENLPVQDNTANVIVSNCVINLSPSKERVFAEAFRVLAPGGRLAISDVIAIEELPETLKTAAALSGCIAGAVTVTEVERLLKEAGFVDIQVNAKPESASFIKSWFPGSGAEPYIRSASIEANKPGGESCCAPSCCA